MKKSSKIDIQLEFIHQNENWDWLNQSNIDRSDTINWTKLKHLIFRIYWF